MREEPCDDSVSDRSAVNVAPFQLSEKLRCIHSNHPLFCYHFVVALAKANPSHNPPREDSDHPCATRQRIRRATGLRNPWLHQYARAAACTAAAADKQTFSDGFSVGRRGCVSVGPRYRDLRGPIAGEAVVTLATPEYPCRLPVASLTRTR